MGASRTESGAKGAQPPFAAKHKHGAERSCDDERCKLGNAPPRRGTPGHAARTEPRPSDGAAPDVEWEVERWFNVELGPSLASLSGRVVVLEAFQMLCLPCVRHALPQAVRIHELFPERDVAMIGLHTVFEHHEAMGPEALGAFLSEYGVRFPVGVDAPGPGHVPRTMERLQLRGTPSLLLFDGRGRLRAHHLGPVSDLQIGAEISALVTELGPSPAG